MPWHATLKFVMCLDAALRVMLHFMSQLAALSALAQCKTMRSVAAPCAATHCIWCKQTLGLVFSLSFTSGQGAHGVCHLNFESHFH